MITSAQPSQSSSHHRLGRRIAGVVAVAAGATGLVLSAAPSADAMPIAPTATAGDLSIAVSEAPTHSAGHSYLDFTFTNVSDHDVRVEGYAGISIVADGNGTQVGRPAVWLHDRRADTVVVHAGGVTTEIVSLATAQDFGPTEGHTVTADGFRVYVPDSRTAKFVPYTFTASTRDVAQLQADPIGARI